MALGRGTRQMSCRRKVSVQQGRGEAFLNLFVSGKFHAANVRPARDAVLPASLRPCDSTHVRLIRPHGVSIRITTSIGSVWQATDA